MSDFFLGWAYAFFFGARFSKKLTSLFIGDRLIPPGFGNVTNSSPLADKVAAVLI